jgi:hypothetical protein
VVTGFRGFLDELPRGLLLDGAPEVLEEERNDFFTPNRVRLATAELEADLAGSGTLAVTSSFLGDIEREIDLVFLVS